MSNPAGTPRFDRAFLTGVAFFVALIGTGLLLTFCVAEYSFGAFGFVVGLYAIAAAYFFWFGQRFDSPFTTNRTVPIRVPVGLFILGAAIVTKAIRAVSQDPWGVDAGADAISHALFVALITGFSVFIYLHHSDVAKADAPARGSPEDAGDHPSEHR